MQQTESTGCPFHERLSALPGVVRAVYDQVGMAHNFIACDRGQSFLLPPPLKDWLAEDHLVWTVLGAVDQTDLDGFYGAYRADGQGRAAFDLGIVACCRMRIASRSARRG